MTENNEIKPAESNQQTLVAGKPIAVAVNLKEPPLQPQTPDAVPPAEAKVGDTTAIAATVKPIENEVPDDKAIEELFGKLGIEYNKDLHGTDKLKERLTAQKPSAVELTEEQKTAAAIAEEKELFDIYFEGGGTLEQWAAVKSLMNADVKELSRTQKLKEFKDAGFDDEEAEALLKEQFYLNKIEELEKDFDETDEEFEARKGKLEKKAQYFNKQLDESALAYKKQAEELYNNFKELRSERKLQAQKELQHAANADAFLKTLPRKQTYELGKLNDQDLAPVHVNVDESDFAEVAEILKSPAKIKQFLYNEDGSYNLPNISDALLKQKTAGKIAKQALLEGQTRMTNIVTSTFPHTDPYELGIGGAQKRTVDNSKQAVKAGKPSRV